MRHAIVDAAGVVQNVILLADKAEWAAPDGGRLVACGDASAQAGDIWSGGETFRRPEPPKVAPEPARVVRKARLLEALDRAGRRADWEAAVAASKQTTRDYWACEPEMPRSNPKMRRLAATCALEWDALVDAAAGL